MTSTTKVTGAMLAARAKMISEISRLDLELHHSGYSGWSLNLMDPQYPKSGRILSEVGFSDTTRGMWNILCCLYEVLAVQAAVAAVAEVVVEEVNH